MGMPCLPLLVAPYFLMTRPYGLDDGGGGQGQGKAATLSGVTCYRTSPDGVMEGERDG